MSPMEQAMEESCPLHGIHSQQSYFRVEGMITFMCSLLFDEIKYGDQTHNSCSLTINFLCAENDVEEGH